MTIKTKIITTEICGHSSISIKYNDDKPKRPSAITIAISNDLILLILILVLDFR